MKRSPMPPRQAPMARGKPMRKKRRPLTPKEREWRAAVLSLGVCVLCGKHGVQWAHRNEGKGMGIKVPPNLTAALCPECHYEIDNGRDLSRADRRSRLDEAIEETHRRLRANGRIPE